MDYWEGGLKMQETGELLLVFSAFIRGQSGGRGSGDVFDRVSFSLKVLRQLDANGAKSSSPAGQCRLTPLIPLILDCSFLYHFSVLLMFKLHSRESARCRKPPFPSVRPPLREFCAVILSFTSRHCLCPHFNVLFFTSLEITSSFFSCVKYNCCYLICVYFIK